MALLSETIGPPRRISGDHPGRRFLAPYQRLRFPGARGHSDNLRCGLGAVCSAVSFFLDLSISARFSLRLCLRHQILCFVLLRSALPTTQSQTWVATGSMGFGWGSHRRSYSISLSRNLGCRIFGMAAPNGSTAAIPSRDLTRAEDAATLSYAGRFFVLAIGPEKPRCSGSLSDYESTLFASAG